MFEFGAVKLGAFSSKHRLNSGFNIYWLNDFEFEYLMRKLTLKQDLKLGGW